MGSTIWFCVGFVLCAWAMVECQLVPGGPGVGGPVAGGTGDMKPAGAEARRVVKMVQHQIAERAGLSANAVFTPTYYRTQVVAGTNYFIKILVGPKSQNQYVHARIFRSLGGNHTLTDVRTGETESSPLNYF